MPSGTRRALLVPFLGVLLLCGWVYLALDRHHLSELSARASVWLVLLAASCSFASYLLICLALLLIGRTLGLRRVPAPMFLLVTFVSLTLNHVISLGVAGYSARVLLLRRGGEAPGTVLAASLLHSYLTTLVMVGLLPIGLAAIAVSSTVPPAGTAALRVAMMVSVVTVAGMTVGLVSRRARLAFLGLVGRIAGLFPLPHATGIARALVDIDIGLATAARSVRERPASALAPMALVLLDWTAVLFAFWLCLEAVGVPVGPPVLIAGFAIGMNAGVVSLVPGGVGVQEGSQAGVLALFGVPFGTALLASVLFRFIYYLVPFLVSLPLYYVILRPMVPPAEDAVPPLSAP
ncbi:MAG: flippase-like domain-containing protein [Dehalococcoidia bacterium]